MFDFPGIRKDENVLTVIRKHPIVYTKIIAVFILTVLLPLSIFLFVWFSYYPFSENHTSGIVIGLFACTYLLYGLLFTSIAWLNEEFDLFVITNQRLIDIVQVSFLERRVATTPLEQIQDATINVKGILKTILNYGDLTIQTASGDASEFYIDHVHNPTLIARKILDWSHERQSGEKVVI